jgi:hypothetical protein
MYETMSANKHKPKKRRIVDFSLSLLGRQQAIAKFDFLKLDPSAS